jgi:hypothetical protein
MFQLIKNMQCIYFDGERCYGNPCIPELTAIYTPTQEDKEKYCTTVSFNDCPRCTATVNYLTVIQKMKK